MDPRMVNVLAKTCKYFRSFVGDPESRLQVVLNARSSTEAFNVAAARGDDGVVKLMLLKAASSTAALALATGQSCAVITEEEEFEDLNVLQFAALQGRDRVVATILEMLHPMDAAALLATHHDSVTALHLAVSRGHHMATEVITKFLSALPPILVLGLANGRSMMVGTNRVTPLQAAVMLADAQTIHAILGNVSSHVASELLRDPVQEGDNEGLTPLHLALDRDDVGVLAAVAQHAAVSSLLFVRVSSGRMAGKTPLHLAALRGLQDHAATLLRFAVLDPDGVFMTDNGLTALHAAVLNGNDECIRVLLDSRDSAEAAVELVNTYASGEYDGMTPLHLAVYQGLCHSVDTLFHCIRDKCFQHYVRDNKDRDHLASSIWSVPAQNGLTAVHIAVMGGQHDVVACVTRYTDDVTTPAYMGPYEGCTPLHMAAMTDNPHVTRVLMEKLGDAVAKPGVACVTSGVFEHMRPLHLAAWSPTGSSFINDMFRAVPSMAMRSALDTYVAAGPYAGMTPMHVAALRGNHTSLGAILDGLVREGIAFAHASTPVSMGSLEGMTAIHIAAQHGHHKCVTLLLDKAGPQLLRQSVLGSPALTALNLAARHGQRLCIDAIVGHPSVMSIL
jgi:ankyrin repeat protein